MTRIEELEDLIYQIDFACRAAPNPEEAIRIIHPLCLLANIPSVVGPLAVKGT